MTVWIVKLFQSMKGAQIEAIFYTEEEAEAYIQSMPKCMQYYMEYEGHTVEHFKEEREVQKMNKEKTDTKTDLQKLFEDILKRKTPFTADEIYALAHNQMNIYLDWDENGNITSWGTI